jgi:nucleotide-binding universal stress UspA family protein
MFERLLLAIDDSPGSEVATAFAIAFAREASASVHVLHINEYLVGGRGVTLHTHDEVRELVGSAVMQLREAGISAGGSACAGRYREVPRRIVEAAVHREAGAIVLGSHRHRGLDRLFSSKVRDRTTRLTSLPVLTAPAPLKLSGRAGTHMDDLLRAEMERAHLSPQ